MTRSEIYVVAEAYGASAVADTFTTWDGAIAYARDRFQNFRSNDCETWSCHEDPGCELAQYHATWQTHNEDAASRIDIAVWPTRVAGASGFDFETHLRRQAAWSEQTCGPGPRTTGIVDHIRKELAEIEADPTDVREWIDVVILALDGAWRCGATPEEIVAALAAKQARNEARTWPDWRTADPNKAIEHDRSGE